MWAKRVDDSGKKSRVKNTQLDILMNCFLAFLCSCSIFLLIKITRYVQLNDKLRAFIKKVKYFVCVLGIDTKKQAF